MKWSNRLRERKHEGWNAPLVWWVRQGEAEKKIKELKQQIKELEANRHMMSDPKIDPSALMDSAIELWDMATTAAVRSMNEEWSDERFELQTVRFTEKLREIISQNARAMPRPSQSGESSTS